MSNNNNKTVINIFTIFISTVILLSVLLFIMLPTMALDKEEAKNMPGMTIEQPESTAIQEEATTLAQESLPDPTAPEPVQTFLEGSLACTVGDREFSIGFDKSAGIPEGTHLTVNNAAQTDEQKQVLEAGIRNSLDPSKEAKNIQFYSVVLEQNGQVLRPVSPLSLVIHQTNPVQNPADGTTLYTAYFYVQDGQPVTFLSYTQTLSGDLIIPQYPMYDQNTLPIVALVSVSNVVTEQTPLPEQPAQPEQPTQSDQSAQPAAAPAQEPVQEGIVLKEATMKDPSEPDVSITGLLPEGGKVSVSGLSNKQLKKAEKEIRDSLRQKNPSLFFVADSGYDIEIHDANGNLYEPVDYGYNVTVNIKDDDKVTHAQKTVVHEATKGGYEEPVEVLEKNNKISFTADHFSKTIHGETYEEFASVTTKTVQDTAYVDERFDVLVEFTMEDLSKSNFYTEIPYNRNQIAYEDDQGNPISGTVRLDGHDAGTYTVFVEDGKAYLCVKLNHDVGGSAGHGEFSMSVKAIGAGEIHYDNTVITIKDPEEKKYDNISITKSGTGPVPVMGEDGQPKEYEYTFEVKLKNNNNQTIENLTVYDSPRYFGNNSFNTKIDTGYYSVENHWYPIPIQYPDSISGGNDSKNYTLTLAPSPAKISDWERAYEYQCENVTLAPNEELTWTYKTVLSAEEVNSKVEEFKSTAYWRNYAGFRVNENTKKEVEKLISYSPDRDPLKKTGRIPSEEGKDIEWIVALETKGNHNAAGKYISDQLDSDTLADGLHYITDDNNEQPYVFIFKNGVKQPDKHMLTWEHVADANRLTTGDPAKIYYDDNGYFTWVSEQKTDADYGYELHYWTNFKQEWAQKDVINKAATNFTDIPGGWVPGEYEANLSLTKDLKTFDREDRRADWEVNIPVHLSNTITNVRIRDYLPAILRGGNRYDNLRDTMDYMANIHLGDTTDGNLLYVKDETDVLVAANGRKYRIANRYWEFSSVDDFIAFSGIHITASGDKAIGEVLCNNGKLGFYTSTYMDVDSGKAAGGLWWIYPNPEYQDNTAISSDGMTNIGSTFPKGTYSLKLTYHTNTPEPGEEAETNTNYVYLNGTTVLGNDFQLRAQDAYSLNPDVTKLGKIEKKITKVHRTEDGKLQITYMALADNRSTKYTSASIRYTDTYEDFLSGLPAGKAKLDVGQTDPFIRNGVKVYKIPCTYDTSDPSGWKLKTASSPEELANDSEFKLITDPFRGYDVHHVSGEWWGGFTRDGLDENGFNYYTPNGYIIDHSINPDDRSWASRAFNNVFDVAPEEEIDWDNFYDTDFSKVTKASFYFVYTVEVDEKDLNVADVLRNTINLYTSGYIVDSSYQDYAILLNELRKNVIDRPTSTNDYTVTYQLDLQLTDYMKTLNSLSVTDTMSDNLELDVQSLEIYRVNDDETETLIKSDGSGPSKEKYTSLYSDHNLSISLQKGEAEQWSDNYVIRYKAKITDFEGRVHYSNTAVIPEGSGVPHSTEGEVFVKRPEGEITNLAVHIYKYDGNNTTNALAGAKFGLFCLSDEKRAVLKQMAVDGKTKAEIEQYLNNLNESDWIMFGEEKTTNDQGIAEFTSFTDPSIDDKVHSILFNHIYRLKETKAPDAYATNQLKTQYFMFYNTIYPSHEAVDGLQNLIRSYASDTAMIQIPNYKTSFRIYKKDAQDTDKALNGFTFELFADSTCTTHVPDYPYPEGSPTNEYLYFPDIPVPATGRVQYYLKETKAPPHYLTDLKRVFIVTVDEEGKLDFEEKILENGQLRDLHSDENPSLIGKNEIGLTISNIPNNTNFEFDKSWLLDGNPSDWPDDVEEITVTLKRTGTNKKGESVENEVTFTVKNDPNQKIDLSKISGSTITSGIVTQIDDPANPNRYHYKIIDLDKYIEGETEGAGNGWTYSISEMEISGYNKPRYILHGSDTAIDTAESTDNGGTIVNDRSSIELPETGGPGTIWMFCLGVGLVLIALLGFVTRSDLTRR